MRQTIPILVHFYRWQTVWCDLIPLETRTRLVTVNDITKSEIESFTVEDCLGTQMRLRVFEKNVDAERPV